MSPRLALSRLAGCLLPPAGIAVLPGHITKLRSLASLDVSGCPLSFLPAVLWRLAALRRVRLNATHLAVSLAHTWEPLTKLPALESIELRWVDRRAGWVVMRGSLGGQAWA